MCLSICMCFPGGPAGKESACNAGDLGLIPELGRYPGAGKVDPLHYSGLDNSMDCIVQEVAESSGQDWMTFTFTGVYMCECCFIFHVYPLETLWVT